MKFAVKLETLATFYWNFSSKFLNQVLISVTFAGRGWPQPLRSRRCCGTAWWFGPPFGLHLQDQCLQQPQALLSSKALKPLMPNFGNGMEVKTTLCLLSLDRAIEMLCYSIVTIIKKKSTYKSSLLKIISCLGKKIIYNLMYLEILTIHTRSIQESWWKIVGLLSDTLRSY